MQRRRDQGETVTKERLVAYALIGAEHTRRMQEHEDKIKRILNNLTEDEYKQLLEFSKQMGDKNMIENLPKWWAMVKKP
jgi:DNA-binding MarR family transcriptional regulator